VRIGPQAASNLGGQTEAAPRRLGAGQATRSLLEGHVGEAVEFVRERARAHDAPVMIDVPLQITGVSADELLLLDRLEVRMLDSHGKQLYRGTAASELLDMAGAFGEGSEAQRGLAHQTIEVPQSVLRAVPPGATLQLEYSLTLLRALAQQRMAAQDGVLKAPEVGICMTRADQNRVRLRCEQLGDPAYCLGATLHGAHAVLVPRQLGCVHDYRRGIPSPTTLLALMGIDLWLRETTGLTQGVAEPTDFSDSYVTLTVYGAPEHFMRTLVLPSPRSAS